MVVLKYFVFAILLAVHSVYPQNTSFTESSTTTYTSIPCIVEGKTYEHGEIFKVSFSGPCIEYTCNQGGYRPTKYGCDDGINGCRPEGSVRTVHTCIQQRCERSQTGVGYRTLVGGCKLNGGCLSVGETYKDRCFTYQCNEIDKGHYITYQLDLISKGCFERVRSSEEPYRCVAVNSTITDGCITRQCQVQDNSYSLRVINEGTGCVDGTACRPVDQVWTENCVTKTCLRHDIMPGYTRLQIHTTDTKCEDTTGTCHDIGSTFSRELYGEIHSNCRCNADCTIEGQTFDHLETFTLASSGPCVHYICENGGYGPNTIECQHNGVCHPLNYTVTGSDCVTRRCENRNGYLAMYITASACSHNNACMAIGTSEVGSDCIQRTCEDVNGSASLSYVYQCMDNGGCFALGHVQTSQGGCTEYVCDIRSGSIGFFLQKHDCSYENQCVPVNGTAESGCNELKCHQSGASVQMVFSKFRCDDNGQCRDLGYVRNSSNSQCIKQTCENRNGSIGFYTSTLGCSYNGQCVDVGSSVTENCQSKTCAYENGSLFMKNAGASCVNADGSCAAQGSVRSDGCAEYTCEQRDNNIGFFLTKEACPFEGECVPVGGTKTSNCIEYKCTKDGSELSIGPHSKQCTDGDSCVPLGQTRVVECSIQTCEDRNSDGFGFFTTETKCKDADGNCHSEGEYRAQGNDCTDWICTVYPDGSYGYTPSSAGGRCAFEGQCVELGFATTDENCHSYECVNTGLTNQMQYTHSQCRDNSGQCQNVGHILSLGSGGCIQYECQQSGNVIGYYVKKQECHDGTQCQPLGHVHTLPNSCLNQTCEIQNGYIGYYSGVLECLDADGTCRALGETRSYHNGCVVQTCKDTTAGVGFVTTKDDCDGGDGTCVAVDATINEECSTKQCVRENNSNILKIIDLECIAENGDCKTPVTSTFPFRLDDNILRNNCSCTVDIPNRSRHYSCS
ncbi:hypothetical protein LOTGIDRAFT_230689 [Lottia gigantea]|uniref:Uncharacterized protein n=1 Tax=Lottia gigantea TaxID=225164 RepID=V4B1Y0_LOTGI|nr:hypothetical protein LOTGIDRAFT_230689 [Lottia gigantea]ESP01406.1 hypothetical protein LOTGIDRAFT_230689 [Lottia gigantea]